MKPLERFFYDKEKENTTAYSRRRRETTKKRWLEELEAYSLHRPVRRNFERNRYRLFTIDRLWEADLIDISTLKRHNDNHTFLLTVIDVFTKYAFVRPLKSKKAGAVIRALKQIIDSSEEETGVKRSPKIFQSDKGKEFKNQYMKGFLDSRGIRQHFPQTHSQNKAAIVERFNRTIQSFIYKYLTWRKTRRYIDVLQQLVHLYNHSVHSTIKMKPADVDETHIRQVYENTRRRHTNDYDNYGGHKQPPVAMNIYTQPFHIGDFVRVSRRKTALEHGYTANWSKKVFRITAIIQKRPFFLYKLKDHATGHPIVEKFYAHEIQKIRYKNR